MLAALALCAVLGSGAAQPAELDKIKALADASRTEKALRRLEKLLTGKPEDFPGRLFEGVLLLELGRAAAAEETFEQLRGQSPERPEPANNLAVLQAASGRRESAIAVLEEVVSRYPTYETAARNLASLRGAPAGEGLETPRDATQVQLVLTAEPESHAGTLPRRRFAPAAVPAGPEVSAPAVPVQQPEVRPAAPEVPAAAPKLEPAVAAAPTAVDVRAELLEVIKAWAAAWSQQRVREYLAFYAADFLPTGFASRQAWETARRQRVAAPSFIEVEIDLESMTVRETGPGAASATFVQRYRSDRYTDTVEKTLGLVREDGAWKIRRETSR